MQELLIKVSEALEDAQQGNLSTQRTVEVLDMVKLHLVETAIAEEAKPAEDRKAQVAQMKHALDTMSVSEEEALALIAHEVNEQEPTILVCSHIADMAGVTRSVIVNALRKLESAGIIKVRSLGMKGSRIETLVPGWTGLVIQRVAA